MRSDEAVLLAMVWPGRIDDSFLACTAHRTTTAFQAIDMAVACAQVAIHKVLARHSSPLRKFA
jgi:hypothetical protein